MTVVFRADASHAAGTGHIIRCAALADALTAAGGDVRFVCREHDGNLVEMLRGRGFGVSTLPAPSRGKASGGERYAPGLGVGESVDAAQTIDALAGAKPDWIVVDHYDLAAGWEQMLRPHAGKLMVIDDLADRPHNCDLLLDQTYAPMNSSRYGGLVPAQCRLLVGPRYALLGPQYSSYRRTLAPRDGRVRRVLVYFGGSDSRNMTGLVLDVLAAREFSHLEADVVIGTNSAHRAAVEAQAARRLRTHVHGTRTHLADLMTQADLAVGAGGVTNWERMCLGLPSIVICLADNQRSTCEGLSAAGLIEYVGDASAAGPREIAAALTKLIGEPDRLMAMSARGLECVDGRGAERVASEMAAL